MQARSTANEKIHREIQNPQMFATDPESFSPANNFSDRCNCLLFVIKTSKYVLQQPLLCPIIVATLD
jgi:hypothetical protein